MEERAHRAPPNSRRCSSLCVMLIWLSAHKTAALWPEFSVPLFIYKIEWVSIASGGWQTLFVFASQNKKSRRCVAVSLIIAPQNAACLIITWRAHHIFEPRRLILAFAAEECQWGCWWRKRAWPNIIEQRRWAVTDWPGAAHVMVRHFSACDLRSSLCAGLAA